MLKSKYARTRNEFKASKIFTDRTEPREVFRRSIREYLSRPQQIVTYYGKGGIGKTALLKTLYANEAQTVYENIREASFHSVFISLDAYDFANPVNILMAVRNGIVGDCGLFDYAMLQYCAKAKLNVEEIMQKNSMLSSPIVGVLNELISLGTASACIPASTIMKCVDLIKDKKLKMQFRDEIKEIETLNEFDIFERLPYYLGLCISNAAKKNHYHVLFLDSYESLLARTEFGTFSVDREEWLKELFLSSEYIRIFIASRDRLRWDNDDPEWNDYLQQHLLANLSDDDSRWFLHQVPISDENVVEVITKNSNGVPLYLDMCVSLFEDDMNSGRPFEMTSSQNGEKIIARYIRYLNSKDKNALKILAAPEVFDISFALLLLGKQQIMYGDEEFQELLSKSIFLSIDADRGLWKVDESVRLHQRDTIGIQKIQSVLGSMLECVLENPKGEYYTHLALVLETVCDKPILLEKLLEPCVEAVEIYADMGFWDEIHGQLSPGINSRNERLKALSTVGEVLYMRRVGKLHEALELIESNSFDESVLGVWHYMYDYHRIQLRHLLGHYDESLQSYAALRNEMELIRPMIPDHIFRAPCMKYADLLFLKGHFSESMEQVQSLLAEKNIEISDEIELLRIKGHIFRFQEQYAESELIYRSALNLAEKHRLTAFIGKLYTNMTEVLCVRDPATALEWFKKADSLHRPAENRIELGKALAAASAAYSMIGEFQKGINYGLEAVDAAERTGYLSGKAFGLAALCYAYIQANDETLYQKSLAELRDIIEHIGVYQYVLQRVEKISR